MTFEPVDFLKRLSPLIPPPFANLIRYHGLFAPRAKYRDLLPAAPLTDRGIRKEAELRGAGSSISSKLDTFKPTLTPKPRHNPSAPDGSTPPLPAKDLPTNQSATSTSGQSIGGQSTKNEKLNPTPPTLIPPTLIPPTPQNFHHDPSGTSFRGLNC